MNIKEEILNNSGIKPNDLKIEKVKIPSNIKRCTCGKNYALKAEDNRPDFWHDDYGPGRYICRKCGGYISVAQTKEK